MADPDYRAMCAELLCAMDEIAEYGVVDWAWVKTQPLKMASQSMAEARTLLAQPVAEGPTDEELDSVMFQAVWGCMDKASDLTNDEMDRLKARAVLARWGNPTPQPPADGEAAELAAELRHFVAEYQQMRGLDPENIYSIQQGDAEKEAHLRISRLTRIADLLELPTLR